MKLEVNLSNNSDFTNLTFPNTKRMNKEELVEYIMQARFLKQFRKFHEVSVFVTKRGHYFRPFIIHLVLIYICKSTIKFKTPDGQITNYGLNHLIVELFQVFRAYTSYGALRALWFVKKKTNKANAEARLNSGSLWNFAYVNPTVWESDVVGGSVAHTIGVVDALVADNHQVTSYVAAKYPFYSKCSEKIIEVSPWCFQVPLSCHLNLDQNFYRAIVADHKKKPFDVIYQRYSAYTYSGVFAKQKLNLPLILEFNGSEAWINKHWGEGSQNYNSLRKQESEILTSADLVVTISDELKDDLILLGVDSNRILVVPNGVNTEVFQPAVKSETLKGQLGIEEEVVFGFCGSFGKWHGVEWLVESYLKLTENNQEFRDTTKLMLIGNGRTYEQCKRLKEQHQNGESILFVGSVPQQECVNYLNLCDVLVSPTRPSSEDMYFFGSPTKLFEYMSLAKAVISSKVGQMARLFGHDEVCFVDPREENSLQSALYLLYQNEQLRSELGDKARNNIISEYSWQVHINKIIKAAKDAIVPQ